MYVIHREPTQEEKEAWIKQQMEISRTTPDFYKNPQFFPVPEDMLHPNSETPGMTGCNPPGWITY